MTTCDAVNGGNVTLCICQNLDDCTAERANLNIHKLKSNLLGDWGLGGSEEGIQTVTEESTGITYITNA